MESAALAKLDRKQLRALERAHEREAAAKYFDQAIELLKNPVVELAAGAIVASWLYSPRATDSFFGGFAKGFQSSLFGAGLVTVITAQQLSGALPYLTGSTPGQSLIGGLLK